MPSSPIPCRPSGRSLSRLAISGRRTATVGHLGGDREKPTQSGHPASPPGGPRGHPLLAARGHLRNRARTTAVRDPQPRESKSEDDPANRQREVFNYRKALHEAVNSPLPLSLRLLRDLHRTLLDQVRGRNRSPGDFRKIQVAIGSDLRFVPPPPQKVMPCLDQLEKYFHAKNVPFDSLVNCFLVHYQFETIHPLIDGNGRVGRLLLAVMLKQCCEHSKPWLYLSEYFEQHREEARGTACSTSSSCLTGEQWVEFCLRGTVHQAKTTIHRLPTHS